MTRWILSLVALAMLAPSPARALVAQGSRLADFVLEDPDGKTVRYSAWAGRTILLIYEDRVAVDWNAALKKRLAREKGLPRSVVVLPVADMRKYGYWPARSFAQREMKNRTKQMGRTLFGDWSGQAAKVLGVTGKTSSVVLVGEDGTVRWTGSGRLTAERIDDLLAVLRKEVPGREKPSKAPDGKGDDARAAPVADEGAGKATTAKDADAGEAAAPDVPAVDADAGEAAAPVPARPAKDAAATD